MSEQHEAIDSDDDWEPTPEEQVNMERYRKKLERYPTFALLMTLLNRHRVIRAYKDHNVTNPVMLDSAMQRREETLDALSEAFPQDPNSAIGKYSLQSILDAVVHEFNPPKGDFDA